MVDALIGTEMYCNEDDYRLSIRQSEITNPFNKPQKCLAAHDETGVEWDECLDKFKDGSININLYNNIVTYTAGDCVSGTIDIDLKTDIHC